MKIVKYIPVVFFLISVHFIYSQTGQLIEITQSTPTFENPVELEDWILNILHGGGGIIDTASITFTGDPQQLGKFERGAPIELDTGLVISTGQVTQLESYNTTGAESYNFNGAKDSDLDGLIEEYLGHFPDVPFGEPPYTGDAAVIEFDYTPYGDEIQLRYVFGSEEYISATLGGPVADDVSLTLPEYQFEPPRMFDVFGISIGRLGVAFENLATITSGIGGNPANVNVFTVNDVNNPIYYRGNPGDQSSKGVQCDGVTRSVDDMLIHKKVIPCTKYHVKIAIEDFVGINPDDPGESRGYFWNSSLFLGGGSLIGGEDAPPWTVTYKWTNPDTINFAGKLIEGGCNDLLVTFKLDYPIVNIQDYYIPFKIESPVYKDNLLITYDDTGDQLTVDSVKFHIGDTIKTIRISAVNLDHDVQLVKFNYATGPCDRPVPNIEPNLYHGIIKFKLINNEPFAFSEDPKVYSAYCKETLELSVTDITSGGVEPVFYTWPAPPFPPIVDSVFDYTVNDSPDYVRVTVKDHCNNVDTAIIRIDNKPIELDQIQQIFLCGPGQSATVPVPVDLPNYPDYSIEHVKWWKQGFPGTLLGDEDGDEITVVYDDVVGDNVWTCVYEVTDVCGGKADSSFIVNQSSLVLNDDGICSGEPINLFTGTPAHWYEWYRIESPDTILVDTLQHSVDNNYPLGEPAIKYLLKIEDNCGEKQQAEMIVYVDTYEPQITVSPQSGEICNGETITLEANENNVAGATTEYLWSNNETTRAITVDASEYHLGVNQYTVTTTTTLPGFYSCTNSADIEFTVYANPEATFSIDPADHPCTNTDISFDYLNDEQNRTFKWDFGDGSSNDNNPHTVHQYSNAGTYYVNLFVEHTYPSGHRCSSDSTATVVVDPLPVPAFTPSPVEGCEPLAVTFSDNSTDVFPNAAYDWTFGDGNTYSGTPGPVNHTYDSAGSYTVGLTVTNTERCFGSTSYQYITVNANPDADFVADPWVTTFDNPEIKFYNESNSDDILDIFEWDFDDNTVSSDENPSHTYLEPGLYDVYFRIQTDKGCWDTVVKQVELSLYVKIYVPNAFSPNGDGLNDKFEIKGTPFTDFHLYIYDRWGKQVWSTHSWENQWDGKDEGGNLVPSGTYIYKIAGTSPDPDNNYELGNLNYQGTVTVIR